MNKFWSTDFESLGRLVGLALWQQVTLDLPLHAVVCEALLCDGDVDALLEGRDESSKRDLLKSLDPELDQSLTWIDNCEDPAAFEAMELPFTDAIDCAEFEDLLKETTDSEDTTKNDDEEIARSDDGQKHQRRRSDETSSRRTSGTPQTPKNSEEEERRRRRRTAVNEEKTVVEEARVVSVAFDAFPEVIDLAGLSDEDLDVSCWSLPPGSRIELLPRGDETFVTLDSKKAFVSAVVDWRLRSSLERPLRAMARGLHAAVPSAVLSDAKKMLSPTDLARLLSGLRDVDVADFKRHAKVAGGLRPDAKEVAFFWTTIELWAQSDKHRLHDLLQFATGSRRVPVGGFAHLVGLNGGKHPFTLSSGAHLPKGALPTAHACICTIDLPKFDTLEQAKTKLHTAVRFL